MRAKKRERPPNEETKSHEEIVRADHEMFLQAFEKPTQIYRYLRTRHFVSPIFLHRTLSYMRGRTTRRKNTRQTCNVDSLLYKTESHAREAPSNRTKSKCLHIAIQSVQEPDGKRLESAEVHVSLVKLCHRKRKDLKNPVMEVHVGSATVPNGASSDQEKPAVVVESKHFIETNGHTSHSFLLHFRVTLKNKEVKENGDFASCNGEMMNGDSPPEPPNKRRRRGGAQSSPCDSGIVEDTSPETQYSAELTIFDRHRQCLLLDGDYQVALNAVDDIPEPPKQATWETVMDAKTGGPFDTFNQSAQLHFELKWTEDKSTETESGHTGSTAHIGSNGDVVTPISATTNGISNDCDMSPASQSSISSQLCGSKVYYQFLYNNNSRQQTEAREDLRCPWCTICCPCLYGLLKHLRSCHPRFSFTCIEQDGGATVDVTYNESYDSSYVGNPQDLYSHVGFAFSRIRPVRRTPVTQVIVYRPKKINYDLSEFVEPEVLDSHGRQMVQGHNRLYYHTVTCQPIRPQEIDNDSEDENYPEWLRQKTVNLLDDFTDVNEGEKEIMKMWNLHVMHHNYIGDYSLPKACQTFVQEYGPKILQRHLVRNFLLHMVSLYDFSLISASTIQRTFFQLQRLQDTLGDLPPDAVAPSGTDCNGDKELSHRK